VIAAADLRHLATLFGRFARPHWRGLLGLSLLSIGTALFAALQPLVLAPALDMTLLTTARPAARLSELTLNNLGPTLLARLGLAGGTPAGTLLAVVTLYVGVVTVAAGLSFASLQLMRVVRTAIANDMQAALHRHLLSLSMPFFVAQRAGELVNRFIYDVVFTAQCFDPVLKGFLESGLQVLVYGFILFRTDPRLAAGVGAVTLLHLGITRLLGKQIRQRSQQSFDVYARIGSLVGETVTGIRVVKSFSAEAFEERRLAALLAEARQAILGFGFYSNSEAPLREVANALAVGAALLLAFQALAAGRLTVPGFVLFVVVARQAIAPFASLAGAVVQLQSMVGSSRRLLELLAEKPAVVDGPGQAPPLRFAIRLDGASFAYGSNPPVLQSIDLEIPRGSMVALVGPSGAGKSTLADLVLRLHDPQAGTVTWDGADVRGFTQASYRRHFGVVSQEALLFNATLEENVAYGRPLVRAEVERACAIANATEFVATLSEGYATVVGDRGTRLSGGQRQRIAIARAVYGRPEVLVLDEATSSLDSESERLVQAAIDEAVRGTTALVIAHRLSTVRRADQIVVLEAGRIAARGRHQELLETSPLYRRLHEAQFGPAPEPAPA
jgi:subfamily B ATP-binding cassette protein MsbA